MSVTDRRPAARARAPRRHHRRSAAGAADGDRRRPPQLRLPAAPPADGARSSASRSGSGTPCSATSTSPRSRAASSPRRTSGSRSRSPPRPVWSSRTPGSTRTPRAGSDGSKQPPRSPPRCSVTSAARTCCSSSPTGRERCSEADLSTVTLVDESSSRLVVEVVSGEVDACLRRHDPAHGPGRGRGRHAHRRGGRPRPHRRRVRPGAAPGPRGPDPGGGPAVVRRRWR